MQKLLTLYRNGTRKGQDFRPPFFVLLWPAILAALLLLGAIQTINNHPGIVHSADGLMTGALILAYLIWFSGIFWMRERLRVVNQALSTAIRAHILMGIGVAITVPLILLHSGFTAVIFADIGMIAFAIDGWTGLIQIAVLAGLFLAEVARPGQASDSAIAGSALSIVSTTALVYTLATAMRQRNERGRLIAELREAHERLQVSAAREIELAALRERNRLAREMHDSLGHALVLIAIKIEAAQRLAAVDPDRASVEWEETKALVRSTMGELRSSLAGLRVPALEQKSFHTALAELGEDLSHSAAIEVSTDIAPDADALEQPVQEAIYRVAQEALANIAKHASAKHAWLCLTLRDGAAALEVTDDGIGLAAAPRSEGDHFGVTGMRERVEALGGTFTLGPRAARGTVLRAGIPMREEIDAGHPHPAC